MADTEHRVILEGRLSAYHLLKITLDPDQLDPRLCAKIAAADNGKRGSRFWKSLDRVAAKHGAHVVRHDPLEGYRLAYITLRLGTTSEWCCNPGRPVDVADHVHLIGSRRSRAITISWPRTDAAAASLGRQPSNARE